MASRIGQNAVLAAETWEIRLAGNAVSRLNGSVPARSKPEIVENLLTRLREERSSRLPPCPDTWREHAKKAVHDLLTEVLEQARRKTELAAFSHANQSKAVAYAERILNNSSAAEDAVSNTYLELLQGKTTPAHFFRALKSNARNMLERTAWEVERFEPTERAFNPQYLPGENRIPGGENDEFSVEPASSRLEDQDPLEQLLHREEQRVHEEAVRTALQDPRWRFCKRKKWAQPLLVHVPK